MRSHCAKLLGMDVSKIRVSASEIGGGFGGKTVVYLEPLAMALSKKARKPVKMVMSREEVFRATGPTSGANVWVKIGVTKDGRITAAEAVLKYQAGAFQGGPIQPGAWRRSPPMTSRTSRWSATTWSPTGRRSRPIGRRARRSPSSRSNA